MPLLYHCQLVRRRLLSVGRIQEKEGRTYERSLGLKMAPMVASTQTSPPELLPRARRFVIAMALRYREHGEMKWSEGRTENISRSGVLFRAQYPLEPETTVQMRFVLPRAISARPPGEVLCTGTVVRKVPPTGAYTLSALAATIRNYRFLRKGGPGRRVRCLEATATGS